MCTEDALRRAADRLIALSIAADDFDDGHRENVDLKYPLVVPQTRSPHPADTALLDVGGVQRGDLGAPQRREVDQGSARSPLSMGVG
jgi:hypothetical protein